MKSFVLAIALVCALSGAALAGEMHTTGAPAPGDTPIGGAPAPGDMGGGGGDQGDGGDMGSGGLALLILDWLF